MQDALRHCPTTRTWPFEVAAFAVIGLFLAVIGPYQSNDASVPERLLYWVGNLSVSGVLILGLETVWPRFAPPALRTGKAGLIAFLVLMSTLQTFVVAFFEVAMFNNPGGVVPLIKLWPLVAIIVVPVVLLAQLLRAHLKSRFEPGPTDAQTADPASDIPVPPGVIGDRLPRALKQSPLLPLQAEDHYVRVYTEAGSDLILLKFRDALAAVDALPGYRLHRSWWAARHAVRSARFRSGTGSVDITGDITAPLSRIYIDALRADGWC